MPNQPPAATIEELLAHGRWVRRLAQSLVADPNVADDLEQQTWAAALERPPAVRGNLRGWLGRVLRHRLLDHRRGERRRVARERAVGRPGVAPSQDELLAQAETRALIAQAVLDLEEPYRSTILLRYFEEQSPRGVAALQGVAESTVRTRTSRALATLRARLRRERGGSDDAWRVALLPLAGWHALPSATLSTGSVIMGTTSTRVLVAAAVVLVLVGVVFVASHVLTDDLPPVPGDDGIDIGRADDDPGVRHAPRLEGSPAPPSVPAQVEAPRAPERVVEGEPAAAGVVEGLVQDEKERPLQLITVLLWDAPGRNILSRAMTDAEGRFRFEALAEGAYRLTVHGPGGANARHRVRPGGPTLLVTLAVADVPRVHPSGRVTEGEAVGAGVVAGTVLDDERRPLADALVALADGPSTVARLTTDESGSFRFENLEDGAYVVYVHRVGWSSVAHPVESGGGALEVRMERGPTIGGVVVDANTREPVVGLHITATSTDVAKPLIHAVTEEDGTFLLAGVSPGTSVLDVGTRFGQRSESAADYIWRRVGPIEAGTLDLRLEVARGLAIEGRIRAPDGTPWTGGATVDVAPITEDDQVDYGGRYGAPAADDGTFRIPGLPAGRYDLTVKAEGEDAPALVHLPRIPAGTLDLVVDLVAGTPLEGRLVDETGAAVEGRGWVWVAPDGTPAGAPGSVAAEILEGGRFRTAPLDPGRAYDIRASGFAGYQEGRCTGVHPGDDDVTVTLARGARIEGRVLLPNGQPAPGGIPVVARATGDDASAVGHERWAYAREVTAGIGGAFVLGGLKGGVRYALRAGGGNTEWIPASVPVEAAPATKVTLRLVQGAALSGRLVDATGEGWGGVQVQARPASGGEASWTRTEPDGRFAFKGVVPGRVVLGATLHGEFQILGTYEAPAEDLRVEVER